MILCNFLYETPLAHIKENEMKNINNWNWPLLVLISWFLYLVSAVWANLGTTQGIYNLSNLIVSLAFIAYLIYYLKNRK